MIPVTLLHFQIKGEANFDATKVTGSNLRGALYAALRIMYDTDDPTRTPASKDQNPVGWLLRLEDDTLSGGKDVPRGMALRPLTATSDCSFGITLYGEARDLIQTIASAVPTMGQLGVGPKRGKFSLIRITAVDLLAGTQQVLWSDEGAVSAAAPEELVVGPTWTVDAERLKIHFLTPTRIISQGHLCHEPDFQVWFQRLLERIRTISAIYTDEPIWVPFRDLLADAAKVRIVEDHTCWVEGWSGSRRDGMVKPLGGFAGTVTYSGDFGQLMPWIRMGQALQVGKNTVKGCGWYRIE